jgi:hypothetical protein
MLGISNHESCAAALADRFRYINTYHDREPFLDVCDPDACVRYASNDIIVCSDVIEHTVAHPLSVIRNLLSMVVPGGTLVLSAPTLDMDNTIEWYGGLHQYWIESRDGGHVLRWDNIRGGRPFWMTRQFFMVARVLQPSYASSPTLTWLPRRPS